MRRLPRLLRPAEFADTTRIAVVGSSAGGAVPLTVNSAIRNNDGAGMVSVSNTGSGLTIFSGTNTYTGTTNIGAGGTLQVGDGSTTGTLGAGNVTANGTLAFNRLGYITVSNAITVSLNDVPEPPTLALAALALLAAVNRSRISRARCSRCRAPGD